MGMNQPPMDPAMIQQLMAQVGDPSQSSAIAALMQQQGGQADAPQDPNMMAGDPGMMGQEQPGLPPDWAAMQPQPQQPQGPDPEMVMSAILDYMMQTIQKGDGNKLNADVLATCINTFATAFSTLHKAVNEPAPVPPEIQMEMEQMRLESQLQTEKARLQIEQERAQMEMQLRQVEAETKLQIMREQADIKADQQATDTAMKQAHAQIDLQHKEEAHSQSLSQQEDQHLQDLSMQQQQAEMQAQQDKDNDGE